MVRLTGELTLPLYLFHLLLHFFRFDAGLLQIHPTDPVGVRERMERMPTVGRRGACMDLELKGKTALVLGGGGGLGGAIASTLAREGANVAVADIDAGALDRAVADIKTAGARGLALTWNLGDLSVIDGNVTKIEQELGGVDILVNITGGPPPTPAAGQDPELWTSNFQSMILSVIAITDRVLPGMKTRKFGRVLTSTTSGVIAPIANLGLSNALRLSLVGWSKTLAREVAKDGVTANIIVPGRVATARTASLDQAKAKRESRAVDTVIADSVATIPMGRYGTTQEFADVAVFLVSPRASYVTGSQIRVDGGLIAAI
jgi:3-oxoacyl-[acyl-carrier protein] reductase